MANLVTRELQHFAAIKAYTCLADLWNADVMGAYEAPLHTQTYEAAPAASPTPQYVFGHQISREQC